MARDQMLARIRAAIGTTPAPPVPRGYDRTGTLDRRGVVDLAEERIADYRATVERVTAPDLTAALTRALDGAASVVLPAGAPAEVVAAVGDRARTDGGTLSPLELDAIDAVVTTAAVCIALTGTVVLDAGPGQGRRALTLVPDRHVVVLHEDQIVETVPQGLARLDPVRPLTFISGPSATSDIELNRVEGVHGPRNLTVLIVGQARVSGSPSTP